MLERVVVEALQRSGINALLPVQERAIAEGMLGGVSLVVMSPTSSGKTLLGEILALHNAVSGKKTAVLIPFKALADERYEALIQMGQVQGLKVALSTGDHPIIELERLDGEETDVVIFTYERFLTLLQHQGEILRIFSTIVIDELQILSDTNRGPGLEWLLTMIRRAPNPPQLVCMCAMAGSLNGVDKWLAAKAIVAEERPIPLTELVVLPNGMAKGLIRSGDVSCVNSRLPRYSVGPPDTSLASFVRGLLLQDPSRQLIVFRATVPGSESTAKSISRLNMLAPARRSIDALSAAERTEVNIALLSCLQHGVAFHNGELTPEERNTVEQGFRDQDIRVLVSTTTLATGVNLPCDMVIIGELERQWQDNKDYKVWEYRNMAGRAGRLGVRGSEGYSCYLAADSLEADRVLRKYVRGEVEHVVSALSDQRLDCFTLHCIVYSGIGISEEEIGRTILDTFAGSHLWDTEHEREALKKSVPDVVQKLAEAELVWTDAEAHYATSLGKICTSSGLDIPSFTAITKYIRTTQDFRPIEFLAHLLDTPSASDRRFPTGRPAQIRAVGPAVIRILKTLDDNAADSLIQNLSQMRSDYPLAKKARQIAVIVRYTQGAGWNEIEVQLGVRVGVLRGLVDEVVRLSEAALRVAKCLNKPFIAELTNFIESVRGGVPPRGVNLVRLEAFSREQSLRLLDMGIDEPIAFLDADNEQLSSAMACSAAECAAIKAKIVQSLGSTISSYRLLVDIAEPDTLSIVHQIFGSRGTELERPVQALFGKFLPELQVRRIKAQASGEADYEFRARDGRIGVIQLASRMSCSHTIGLKKAGDVLQQSPELRPEIFVCIAFPGFDNNAKMKAEAHGRNNNYKAIPLPGLVEACLRVARGEVSSETLYGIFEDSTGFVRVLSCSIS